MTRTKRRMRKKMEKMMLKTMKMKHSFWEG